MQAAESQNENIKTKVGLNLVPYVVLSGDGMTEKVQDFYIRCKCDTHVMTV
jgi:hypothetical protein